MPPAIEVKPGDPTYAELYAYWSATHRPGTIERLASGWQYRVIWPNPSSEQPTFVLVASGALTDADHEGPPGGITRAFATRQSSLPGRGRELAKD